MMKCAFLTALSREIPNDERTPGAVIRHRWQIVGAAHPTGVRGGSAVLSALRRDDAGHRRSAERFD